MNTMAEYDLNLHTLEYLRKAVSNGCTINLPLPAMFGLLAINSSTWHFFYTCFSVAMYYCRLDKRAYAAGATAKTYSTLYSCQHEEEVLLKLYDQTCIALSLCSLGCTTQLALML